MSVCIAIICNHGKQIVTVTDKKVDFGDYSADNIALKNWPLGGGWFALFAGDDVEHARPILTRAREILGKITDDRKPMDYADAVDIAFGEFVQREVANKVLRKRGFTVDSFVEKWRAKCTPSVYLSLCNRIDQVSIKLQFLVCGFDPDGQAHIFKVDGDSAPKCYDSVGMWAIGSGAHSAMSCLAYYADMTEVHQYMPSEHAVFFGLAAKFMAESSGDVGKQAAFVLVHDSTDVSLVPSSAISKIRTIWDKEASLRAPDRLTERIQPMILSGEELDKSQQ